MLKSILLRMLAVALAFGVGIGSGAIFGRRWEPPPIQEYQKIEPPITLKVESVMGDSSYPLPLIRYSLYNQSRNSIWVIGDAGRPFFGRQEWINNQWIDNWLCCIYPNSGQPIEITPNSSLVFDMAPDWRPLRQRIGIQIFWERPKLPVEGLREPPDFSDYPGFVIWTRPFRIQHQVTLEPPLDHISRKN